MINRSTIIEELLFKRKCERLALIKDKVDDLEMRLQFMKGLMNDVQAEIHIMKQQGHGESTSTLTSELPKRIQGRTAKHLTVA